MPERIAGFVIAWCIAFGCVNVYGDPFAPPSLADTTAEGIANAIAATQQWAGAKAEFNQNIAQARAAMWRLYPDGDGFDEARRRFTRLLDEKDYFYIAPCIAIGWSQGIGKMEAANHLAGGTQLDDGIPAEAKLHMELLVRKVRESAGAPGDQLLLVPSPAVTAAFNANRDAYLNYLRVRDRIEFKKVFDSLAHDSDRDYLIAALAMHDEIRTVADARLIVDLATAAVGQELVNRTAGHVRRWKKDEWGDVDFGDRPGSVSFERSTLSYLESMDPSVWLIRQLRSDYDLTWERAAQIYEQYWVQPFGKAVCTEVARKSLEETRQFENPRKMVEHARQLMPQDPLRDMPLGSLASTEPGPYLLALIHASGEVENWSQARAAYEQTLSRHGEQATLDIAARVRNADRRDDGQLSDPAALGVDTADPYLAVRSLLVQAGEQPDRYLMNLLIDSGATKEHVSSEYDYLVWRYGQEHVDGVAAKVRDARADPTALKAIDGAVSGFVNPAMVFYDVLWSTADPLRFAFSMEQGRLAYSMSLYGKRPPAGPISAAFKTYGKDKLVAAATKVAKAPRVSFKVTDVVHNRSFSGVLPADPSALGVPASDHPPRDAMGCIAALVRVEDRNDAAANQNQRPTFEVGQKFQIRWGRDWVDAQVLRTGPTYLIQLKTPNNPEHKQWATPEWIQANMRTDGAGGASNRPELSGGKSTGSAEPPAPAGEDDKFPVGTAVRLKLRDKVVDAKVVQSLPGNGWTVEWTDARSGQMRKMFIPLHSGDRLQTE